MKYTKHTNFRKQNVKMSKSAYQKTLPYHSLLLLRITLKWGNVLKKIRTDALYYYKVLQAMFRLTTGFEGDSVAEWLERRI